MDLRLLSRFIVVAETGSINKAAARLNLSQPALTKSIQLLEERMDVTLIVRGPRGISLTEVGETMLKHAKLMEAEVRKLDGEISAFKNISMGHVRIGVPPGPGFLTTVMPEATRRFANRGLRVTLDITMGTRADLLRPLLLGDLDFIIASAGEEDIASELISEDLYGERRLIVVAADHPLAGKAAVTPEDLQRYPWAILKQGQFMPGTLHDLTGGQESSFSAINSNSTQFIKIMLYEGNWIGLVTYDSVRVEIQKGLLVELTAQADPDVYNPIDAHMMQISYRRDVPLSTAGARLMREIRNACTEQYYTPSEKKNAAT